jgi:small-conductance mechanosensitive channel
MNPLEDLLAWGPPLALGFPLSIIVLTEVVEQLERRRSGMATPLRLVRSLVLPVLALQLLVRKVLGLDGQQLPTRFADTLLCATAVTAGLSLSSAMMETEAGSSAWWTRLPKLLLQLTRLVLLTSSIAFVLAYVWDVDLRGVMTALGIGSLVMALALQDTLSNLVSGVLLIFDRPFKVGDWVKSGEVVGQVEELNWRSVRLRTQEQDLVVIPNSLLGAELIHNYSQPSAERLQVALPHGARPNRVHRMLRELAMTTRGVLTHPAPEVRTLAYEQDRILYELRFFLMGFEQVEAVRGTLMTRIYYAARRYGLTLSAAVGNAADLEAEDRETALAETLEILSSVLHLDHASLGTLMQGAERKSYGAEEDILRMHEPTEGLYIIMSGAVSVSTQDEQGRRIEVTRLGQQEFFGEAMVSAHTPSPVTITALEDSELLLLLPEEVVGLAQRSPGFAKELEQLLDARRKAVDEARREKRSTP